MGVVHEPVEDAMDHLRAWSESGAVRLALLFEFCSAGLNIRGEHNERSSSPLNVYHAHVIWFRPTQNNNRLTGRDGHPKMAFIDAFDS
jgi:hypothetical protein